MKKRYPKRFESVLPPKKLARFFQVDNKMDAFISATIARNVKAARLHMRTAVRSASNLLPALWLNGSDAVNSTDGYDNRLGSDRSNV